MTVPWIPACAAMTGGYFARTRLNHPHAKSMAQILVQDDAM
jgi:hypothetical protein